MNPATFDEHFPGAPGDDELRRQCLRSGSAIGASLYKLGLSDELMPACTARDLIVIMLVMGELRKATETKIIKHARNLPYLCRVLAEGTPAEKEGVETLLVDMAELLDDATSTFCVDFPPDGYEELRAEPKLKAQKENADVWYAWRDKLFQILPP